MTAEERALLVLLGEVWNRFAVLPEMHPADVHEFVRAIHAAQSVLMRRPAMRGDPDFFYANRPFLPG